MINASGRILEIAAKPHPLLRERSLTLKPLVVVRSFEVVVVIEPIERKSSRQASKMAVGKIAIAAPVLAKHHANLAIWSRTFLRDL